MLRRLHPEQPDSFAFTPANRAWAEAQVTKYPEGRQASAVIPLLWRAQEQEGWLTRPAMEHVAEMLGMAYIRVLEVATFYFMFQLQPVGTAAHLQICGTTSCMICGAEDLVEVCRRKIAAKPHQLSEDGKLSWEEVECLGACANAPMAQIGKDYYEDLSPKRLEAMIDAFRAGEVPTPGPQNGRWASEPLGGATSLTAAAEAPDMESNASITLATDIGDTLKRIDGTEVPLSTPWTRAEQADADPEVAARDPLLGPDGPDGAQSGRVDGDEEVDRGRGDASDGVSEVPGESAEDGTGRPEEGSVARDPEGHPGEGLGGDATAAEQGAEPGPQVTGTTDSDGEPQGSQSATEATATPEGSTGSADPEGQSGEAAEAGARVDGRQAPVAPGNRGETHGAAPAVGSATGHDGQTEADDVSGGPMVGVDGAGTEGRRPEALAGPRDGQADDLKKIKGIGPKLEAQCNELGFYHFDQIAAWTEEEVAWVDSHLEGFSGRVTRDEWVSQARLLAQGGDAESTADE